jgi:NAD-dependent deacetylase
LFLCTQNVDSLHEQAGSQRVLHMHGRLMMTRCSRQACPSEPFEDSKVHETELPKCEACGALLRPHVCWFGETPYEMDRIFAELDRTTILMTVGSSGVVEPAASFVRLARRNGARTIYIGPEEPAKLVGRSRARCEFRSAGAPQRCTNDLHWSGRTGKQRLLR